MRDIIKILEAAEQTAEQGNILNEEFVRSLNEQTYQPMGEIIVEADTTDEEINEMIESMFNNLWQADADK